VYGQFDRENRGTDLTVEATCLNQDQDSQSIVVEMFTNRFALVVKNINLDTLVLRLTEGEDHKQPRRPNRYAVNYLGGRAMQSQEFAWQVYRSPQRLSSNLPES
jgi:hypothetical protein